MSNRTVGPAVIGAIRATHPTTNPRSLTVTEPAAFTAALVERTVIVTWPHNDRGGATPPADDWQERAWASEPTLHEIDEGSVSGCSVLRWRNDPRPDAELVAESLALVSGEPASVIVPPPADRAAEPPETDEERADREETERDHAAGNHRYCGVTCEVEFPTEMLRNGILAKGYPGTAGMLDELLRRAAEAQSTTKPEHQPRRGDEFEAWLKAQRDEHPRPSHAWFMVDCVLDRYRLHADTGTPLGEHVCEGRAVCGRECLDPAAGARQDGGQTQEADRG